MVGPLRCRGLFADLDIPGDVVMVSIPRRCIGDPRRVQIRAVMAREGSDTGETLDARLDSAMVDGGFRRGWSPWIRSGPSRAV